VEESNKGHSSEEEKHAQSMDRRRLLKMMATTTGAAGASFLLPAKWTKPLFDVIILPAHAATSTDNPPIISNFTVRSLPPNPLNDSNFTVRSLPPNPLNDMYSGKFDYSDGPCEVNAHYTRLQYTVSGGGQLHFESGETISNIPGTVNGDGCYGNIGFGFNTNAYDQTLNISLNVSGRYSNVLNGIIPWPYNINGTN